MIRNTHKNCLQLQTSRKMFSTVQKLLGKSSGASVFSFYKYLRTAPTIANSRFLQLQCKFISLQSDIQICALTIHLCFEKFRFLCFPLQIFNKSVSVKFVSSNVPIHLIVQNPKHLLFISFQFPLKTFGKTPKSKYLETQTYSQRAILYIAL